MFLLALVIVFWGHRMYAGQPDEHMFLVNTDMFIYHVPTAAFLHDEIANGNLPLWNPYQLAGQPFLGLLVPGAFYPPNILLMGLLEPGRALEAHALCHLLIAGLFTWLFAGRLGLGTPARLTAAVAYMLSAPVLDAIYLPAYMSTLAWLPAFLWVVHGLLTEARARWVAGVAIVPSLAFLGGHTQGFVYVAQLVAAYGLFGWVVLVPRGARRRVLGLAALSGFLALGLVAPQLLPALEMAREGVRDLSGLSFAEASELHLAPLTVLRGLAGLGTPDGEPQIPGPSQWSAQLPLLGLPLIACGFLLPRLRAHWFFFLGAAVVVGLYLLGPQSPVFGFFYSLPLGSLFRGPIRISFVYMFLVALLVGLGVEGISSRLAASTRGRFAPAIVAVVASIVGLDYYARSELALAHPVLSAPSRGGPSELIEYLRREAGHQRVFVETFPDSKGLLYKLGMMNRLFALPDYEPSMPGAYWRYFSPVSAPLWHGELSVRGPAPVPEKRLLDLMSVRYYAVAAKKGVRARSLEAFAGGRRHMLGSAEVVESKDALPRAYAVRRIRVEPDEPAALARILSDSFRPRQEAVLTDSPGDPESPLLAALGGPSAGAPDRVTIRSYEAEEVVIEADCASNCFVVLTDLYYPGWRVYVDGQRERIHRANALFRGVPLEAGHHRVVYRYQPESLRVGLGLLFGTLLSSAAGVAYSARRRAMAGRNPHGP